MNNKMKKKEYLLQKLYFKSTDEDEGILGER